MLLNLLIFSEIFCIWILLLFCSQSNALMMSLLLIPLSIFYILSSMSLNLNSSMILIIYILVFIGGLLVLLVSVASISSNEQMINMPKMLSMLIVPVIPFFFLKKDLQFSFNNSLMMSWLENEASFVCLVLTIILVSLIFVTKNSSKFKGMIRTI